jgi:hypothetical protein
LRIQKGILFLCEKGHPLLMQIEVRQVRSWAFSVEWDWCGIPDRLILHPSRWASVIVLKFPEIFAEFREKRRSLSCQVEGFPFHAGIRAEGLQPALLPNPTRLRPASLFSVHVTHPNIPLEADAKAAQENQE